MEEVEVESRRAVACEVGLVGQAGRRVLGGEAGDVVRGAHRLLERGQREVRGARVAAPLADVDRDRERLVAVALDVLGLALAHRDRQAHAFGNLGDRVAGAERLRRGEGRFDEVLELVSGVGEAGRWGSLDRGAGRH